MSSAVRDTGKGRTREVRHPVVLCKYMKLSRAEEIICTNHIWCPGPTSFNDPFDCGRIYDVSCRREEVVRQMVSYLTK
jgi:hypothetical protein